MLEEEANFETVHSTEFLDVVLRKSVNDPSGVYYVRSNQCCLVIGDEFGFTQVNNTMRLAYRSIMRKALFLFQDTEKFESYPKIFSKETKYSLREYYFENEDQQETLKSFFLHLVVASHAFTTKAAQRKDDLFKKRIIDSEVDVDLDEVVVKLMEKAERTPFMIHESSFGYFSGALFSPSLNQTDDFLVSSVFPGQSIPKFFSADLKIIITPPTISKIGDMDEMYFTFEANVDIPKICVNFSKGPRDNNRHFIVTNNIDEETQRLSKRPCSLGNLDFFKDEPPMNNFRVLVNNEESISKFDYIWLMFFVKKNDKMYPFQCIFKFKTYNSEIKTIYLFETFCFYSKKEKAENSFYKNGRLTGFPFNKVRQYRNDNSKKVKKPFKKRKVPMTWDVNENKKINSNSQSSELKEQ